MLPYHRWLVSFNGLPATIIDFTGYDVKELDELIGQFQKEVSAVQQLLERSKAAVRAPEHFIEKCKTGKALKNPLDFQVAKARYSPTEEFDLSPARVSHREFSYLVTYLSPQYLKDLAWKDTTIKICKEHLKEMPALSKEDQMKFVNSITNHDVDWGLKFMSDMAADLKASQPNSSSNEPPAKRQRPNQENRDGPSLLSQDDISSHHPQDNSIPSDIHVLHSDPTNQPTSSATTGMSTSVPIHGLLQNTDTSRGCPYANVQFGTFCRFLGTVQVNITASPLMESSRWVEIRLKESNQLYGIWIFWDTPVQLPQGPSNPPKQIRPQRFPNPPNAQRPQGVLPPHKDDELRVKLSHRLSLEFPKGEAINTDDFLDHLRRYLNEDNKHTVLKIHAPPRFDPSPWLDIGGQEEKISTRKIGTCIFSLPMFQHQLLYARSLEPQTSIESG